MPTCASSVARRATDTGAATVWALLCAEDRAIACVECSRGGCMCALLRRICQWGLLCPGSSGARPKRQDPSIRSVKPGTRGDCKPEHFRSQALPSCIRNLCPCGCLGCFERNRGCRSHQAAGPPKVHR